jgi:hypothetical protein
MIREGALRARPRWVTREAACRERPRPAASFEGGASVGPLCAAQRAAGVSRLVLHALLRLR